MAAKFVHDLSCFEARLDVQTAELAKEHQAVCLFMNDEGNAKVLQTLAAMGIKKIAMRAAGYNNIDLEVAKSLGFSIARVPAYSPYAVAEHAVALMLCLNRKIHRAYNRTRDHNFDLSGLTGFDMNGRHVGIVGFGKIGQIAAKILTGFGCKVKISDPYADAKIAADLGVQIADLDAVCGWADILSLHVPLLPQTRHLVNAERLKIMKDGVMLINTSRGGLIDTAAAVSALKSGKIGALGIDVYEREQDIFFENHSGRILQDDMFARLITFPNVLVTGHQAFLTTTALENIAEVTMQNLSAWEAGDTPPGDIKLN